MVRYMVRTGNCDSRLRHVTSHITTRARSPSFSPRISGFGIYVRPLYNGPREIDVLGILSVTLTSEISGPIRGAGKEKQACQRDTVVIPR